MGCSKAKQHIKLDKKLL